MNTLYIDTKENRKPGQRQDHETYVCTGEWRPQNHFLKCVTPPFWEAGAKLHLYTVCVTVLPGLRHTLHFWAQLFSYLRSNSAFLNGHKYCYTVPLLQKKMRGAAEPIHVIKFFDCTDAINILIRWGLEFVSAMELLWYIYQFLLPYFFSL